MTQIEAMKQALEAFDTLARLGNGNMIGNSDGNRIASAAYLDLMHAIQAAEKVEPTTEREALKAFCTWIPVSEKLPELLDGRTISDPVLAGYWYDDPWLRDDLKHQFSYGICSIMEVKKCRDFPQGRQWITHGCSHNAITHWMPLPTPPKEIKGLL